MSARDVIVNAESLVDQAIECFDDDPARARELLKKARMGLEFYENGQELTNEIQRCLRLVGFLLSKLEKG